MSDTNLDKMKAMHQRLAMRGKAKYSPPASAQPAPQRDSSAAAAPAQTPVEKAPGPAEKNGKGKRKPSN